MTSDSERWPAETLMARLPDDIGGELLRVGSTRQCPGVEALLYQGDPNTHVYVLGPQRQGGTAKLKVSATLENGVETLLGIRVSGDLVGELAALRHDVRSATVTTCAPMVVHAITRDAFSSFLDRHPSAWEAVCRMIADRLDWANRRRSEYAAYDVSIRLARVVVELAERHGAETEDGYDVGVSLSQAELGQLIGAKEDAIAQAMRHMRQAGLVVPRYRGLTIVRVDSLRRFAELV